MEGPEIAWSPLLREERMVNWSRGGRVLRRQPPIRIRYCQTPTGACVECAASTVTCPACQFTYCADDLAHHVRAFAVPPDAWKTTFRKLVFRWQDVAGETPFLMPRSKMERLDRLRAGEVVVGKSPPIRVEYCTTPPSSQVDLPCVHQAATCKPGSEKCRGCGFTYCPHHLVRHVRRFAWPRKNWRRIVVDYEQQKELAAKDPKHGIWVDVLPLEDVE